ncbi:unnamed protein product [Leptosia nina]|uniref:Uncharacterized protein n=1 Tax=Leptosia nina TaxID=320188 RepID=A0AAV1JU20_9NEOP
MALESFMRELGQSGQNSRHADTSTSRKLYTLASYMVARRAPSAPLTARGVVLRDDATEGTREPVALRRRFEALLATPLRAHQLRPDNAALSDVDGLESIKHFKNRSFKPDLNQVTKTKCSRLGLHYLFEFSYNKVLIFCFNWTF